MEKILFRKLLFDCLIFFLITLIASSTVIWIFQAVNFLDIIIDDGRDYLVYLNFSILNFPKIISRILPFVFFFSFFYIITKYELNNELLILWSHGVNKIHLFNFFIKFSMILVIFQIILASYIVPHSLDYAKSFIRSSDINFLDNFIKPRKFNDTAKGLTLYADKKNDFDEYENIYIKRGNSINNSRITYAKKGISVEKKNNSILELYDGETISIVNGKISSFKFSKFDFSLQDVDSNTTTYIKTQEMPTSKLIKCYFKINKIEIYNLNFKNELIENCSKQNLDNILKETNKRIIVPFYIILLMMTILMLALKSKESTNYLNFRIFIFITGVLIIVFSEISLRFIGSNIKDSTVPILLPFLTIFVTYIFFLIKLKFSYKQ